MEGYFLHRSLKPVRRALSRGLGASLMPLLGCSASPCASSSPSIAKEVVTQQRGTSATASVSEGAPVPPPSAISSSAPLPADTASEARVTMDLDDGYLLVNFPTSISVDGDRIAGMIAADDNLEHSFPTWLLIKDLKSDKVQQSIDLIDGDMFPYSSHKCRDRAARARCIADVERRVHDINALLANDQWRPFPCFSGHGRAPSARTGPGCELLSELTFEFQDPRLVISRGDHPVVTRSMPTWSRTHRKPQCKGILETEVESVAFEPETGLFVIGLSFFNRSGEAGDCQETRWDFHPISLPMFRREVPSDSDGGTP